MRTRLVARELLDVLLAMLYESGEKALHKLVIPLYPLVTDKYLTMPGQQELGIQPRDLFNRCFQRSRIAKWQISTPHTLLKEQIAADKNFRAGA